LRNIYNMMRFSVILMMATFVCGTPEPEPHHASKSHSTVQCRTDYVTIWDTKYKETETQQCTTEYEKKCKTEYEKVCKTNYKQQCQTVYEKQCETVYKQVCVQQYKTEYEPYVETECVTKYKEDCEYQWVGEGNNKIWAPIEGTCKKNPYDECNDVSKTKAKQVAYPVCNDVPEQKCVDIPKQECVSVPEQICTNVPYQTCVEVPKQNCVVLHKKVPIRISKQIPKKTCDDHSDKYANDVLTEVTRNVSLSTILGLLDINTRSSLTDLNNTTTEAPDYQETEDQLIFQ